MKRLITTIALALLVVPATFAGEQSLLAREFRGAPFTSERDSDDRFFETKREALSWVSRNPLFMTVRVVPSN